MRNRLRGGLRALGYDIVRHRDTGEPKLPTDMTDQEVEIYRKVRPYTMTSVARVITLVRAVEYIVANGIEGDFVECGVWRGGSMMAVAHALMRLGETRRRLHLFDTFVGMPSPTGKDVRYDGAAASKLLATAGQGSWVTAYASLDDVRRNMGSTGYPMENVHLIQGKVEDTLPEHAPVTISLLRLDTDWYESTRHELLHLYPRLVSHGLLLIDDYGHWRGAKDATDEYFAESVPRPFLHRVDFSARLVVKT